MSKAQPVASAQPGQKRNTVVPVVLICDPCCQAVIQPYCSSVISTLSQLHPTSQILVTSLTPSSQAIPTHPFLPPNAFLSSLSSVLRRPARPSSTLWRSSSGVLRAIVTAKKLLASPINGSEGEAKSQLPKYVVVISATDVSNHESEEIWLEDEEPPEEWESVAKNFTKVPHTTTLFSLISLGHTPNLEAFWRESSGRFPPHLVYNSTTANASSPFTFPLYGAAHACFLIGFYNSRTAGAASGANTPASGTPTGANIKRNASNDPTSNNKKAKANTPIPGAASALGPQSFKDPSKPSPANSIPPHTRTPSGPIPQQPQNPIRRTASPALPPPPAVLTNESLQAYMNEMKANAARTGAPPPGLADVQAAIAAYTNGGQAAANPASSPFAVAGQRPLPPPGSSPNLGSNPLQQLQQQQQLLQQQAQQRQQSQTPQPLQEVKLTPAQIAALPPIPNDMRLQIESHLVAIRAKVANGTVSQEHANLQMKQLHDVANQHRFNLANQQAMAARATQGLGLNVPVPSQQQQQQQRSRPASTQPQQNPYLPTSSYPGQPNAQGQVQQQPQPAAGLEASPPRQIWRGSISWSLTEATGSKLDYMMYCSATPMPSSAARDLAEAQFPQALRISSLVSIKMSTLQELSSKHSIPAVTIAPIPNDTLPKELRDKQTTMGGADNEALYTMFAHSMEHRSHCGIVKFAQPNTGMVMVSMPKQSKFVALVFTKVGMPEAWLQGQPAQTTPVQISQILPQQHQPPPQTQQQQQQQQQQQPHPNSMFATQPPLPFPPNQHFAPPPPNIDLNTFNNNQFNMSNQQQLDLAELQRMLSNAQ